MIVDKAYLGNTEVDLWLGEVLLTPVAEGTPNTFAFTLDDEYTTSAGMFKPDGSLVRTLWSNEVLAAGDHVKLWDGLDDNGDEVLATDLEPKVLINQVEYAWDGIIGNSFSNDFVRPDLCMDFCIVGSTAYICAGYAEGRPSEYKINLSTKAGEEVFNDAEGTRQSTYNVCTDGTKVFWGGNDEVAGQTFIHASLVNDDSGVTFSSGTTPFDTAFGNEYVSATDIIDIEVSRINGIASNGTFLFVARNNGTIHAITISTGALAQTISILAVLRVFVQGSYLWVIAGNNTANTLTRYTINVDGTLTSNNLTISGLVNPLAGTTSPDGTKIAICDGGSSQQVKQYNATTGALISTLGQSGGYTSTPLIADDRFMFMNPKNLSINAAVAFQSDGSLWVYDAGNYRLQHFNTSNVYVDNVILFGYNYSVQVDMNDPERLFLNYTEIKIDYTKTLATAGSWILYKNWASNITYDNGAATRDRMKDVFTSSVNGKTYCAIKMPVAPPSKQIAELSSTGLRFTGVFIDESAAIDPDGSQRIISGNPNEGEELTIYRIPLSSFDGSSNPVYGAWEEIGTAPAMTDLDPIGTDTAGAQQITSTDYIATFASGPSLGYHLGLLPIGGTDWKLKFAPSTFRDYRGDYPETHYFDAGNGVLEAAGYAGGWMRVIERNIIYNYVGEFWKGYVGDYTSGETNKMSHFYDNGLMVGQYGVIKGESPGMAGNAFGGALALHVNDIYQYNNDESFYGGIHRWSAKSIDTIDVIDCTLGTNVLSVDPFTDLLAVLPAVGSLDTLVNNTGGITRYPTADNDQITTTIGQRTYDRFKSADLHIHSHITVNETYYFKFHLGVNLGLSSWTLKSIINIAALHGNYGSNGSYIDILDNADKVITRFFLYDLNDQTPVFNDQILVASLDDGDISWRVNNPFIITANAGTLSCTFSTYTASTSTRHDATSNWQNPSKIRFSFYHDTGASLDLRLNIVELKFKAS